MQKLGVNWGTLKTTDTAGLWSMTANFTAGAARAHGCAARPHL